jgi:Maf-like protein
MQCEVVPSIFAEDLPHADHNPASYVVATAKQKTLEVASRLHGQGSAAPALIIGADTVRLPGVRPYVDHTIVLQTRRQACASRDRCQKLLPRCIQSPGRAVPSPNDSTGTAVRAMRLACFQGRE